MKNLSAASRKSSSGGVSSHSSPRPSITGASLNYPSQNNNFINDTRMTSVDEETTDASNNNLLCTNDKLKDPRVCNERSDSGFSECSNCSTPSASCVCNHPSMPHIEKSDTIVEEQNSSSASTSTIEPADESHTDHDARSEISSLEFDDNGGGGDRTNCDNGSGCAHEEEDIVLSIRVPTRRELYQNEFGVPMSEIERRKVSLENDSAKKQKKTTTSDAAREEFSLEKLKKSSKVALLMEKFEKGKAPVTNDEESPSSPTNSLDVVVFVDEMCDLAKNDANHASNTSFISTAKCPSPAATRKSPTNQTTTFRLSDRVREVTERLSKPKQLAMATTTPEKNTKTGILTKQSSNFARSKEFWKR